MLKKLYKLDSNLHKESKYIISWDVLEAVELYLEMDPEFDEECIKISVEQIITLNNIQDETYKS